MWIFKRVADIQAFLQHKSVKNQTVGFVPTMGALHAGHVTLVEQCNAYNDWCVASIFVNPTQFNDKKDLEKYPKTIETDIVALIKAGCNLLFLPDVEDIYPDKTEINYDLGDLEKVFEGAFRPGHFQGVCQVVDRLFRIVNPTRVYFGQKDYQQCMVINKLIETTPAFKKIEMHIVPTIREENGLAMSSRNMRLNDTQKATAAKIYETLLFLKNNVSPGDLSNYLAEATKKLADAGFKPDYVSIAHAKTLEELKEWNGKTPLVALMAAFLDDVRLIDNMVLTD